MNGIKYMLPMLLLLGGCSTEVADMSGPSSQENQPLEFRAFVGTKAGELVPESDYFEEGDQIRIYTQKSYTVPSFTDNSPDMYVYEYTRTGSGDTYPYKFSPLKGTSGFDWRDLELTSSVYLFEALHFPGKAYMDKVPDRQDQTYPAQDTDPSSPTISGLEAADMLIAHSRLDAKKSGETVQLTFYHAFVMVEVTVEIPAAENPADGLFPEDALQEVYMDDMLTSYTVNYMSSDNDHGLRSVHGDTNKEREDVYMKAVDQGSDKFFNVTDPDGNDVRYQRYVYRGIVPQQEFLYEGRNFLFFKVRRNDNLDETATTLYRFFYDGGFSLEQSKILRLSLKLDSNLNELVVVTAEVKPWIEAGQEFEIFPELKK